MTRKLNIDELAKKMFESIEITVDGKDYVIDSIPNNIVNEMTNLSGGERDMAEVIAKFLGADPKVFYNTDIRKLGIISKAILEIFKEEMEAFTSKNVFEEKPESKQS